MQAGAWQPQAQHQAHSGPPLPLSSPLGPAEQRSPEKPQHPAPILCAPVCSAPAAPAPRGRALTWVQDPADHPRHDDHEQGQHLQVAGQDGAGLGMAQALGRERPLDDDLRGGRGMAEPPSRRPPPRQTPPTSPQKRARGGRDTQPALLPAQLHRNADSEKARALPRDELSTQQDLAAPVWSGGTSTGLGRWGRHHLMSAQEPEHARSCRSHLHHVGHVVLEEGEELDHP